MIHGGRARRGCGRVGKGWGKEGSHFPNSTFAVLQGLVGYSVWIPSVFTPLYNIIYCILYMYMYNTRAYIKSNLII